MDAFTRLLTEYDVLGALWMTIKLAVVSALGSLVIGTVVAVCRVSPVAVLSGLIREQPKVAAQAPPASASTEAVR